MNAMDTIVISDLEVFYRVGVTEAERAQPQRLLLSVELALDFKKASSSDDLAETIDYDALCQKLRQFGDGVHWSLIETLAVEVAAMILEGFPAPGSHGRGEKVYHSTGAARGRADHAPKSAARSRLNHE